MVRQKSRPNLLQPALQPALGYEAPISLPSPENLDVLPEGIFRRGRSLIFDRGHPATVEIYRD
jgi:hypothetical protein